MDRNALRIVAPLLCLIGVTCLILGLLWPAFASNNPDWSATQAEEFATASAALHHAAHDHSGGTTEQDFQSLQQRFDTLKAELEDARTGPVRFARWLKLAGIALTAAGVAIKGSGVFV